MKDVYEFSEAIGIDNVYQGERFVESLGPGKVTPKSERQAFACEQAMEAYPDKVKRKAGK